MKGSKKVEFINPPNRLREIVDGSGPISEEMLERAQTAITQLGETFHEVVSAELERLSELFEVASKEPDRRLEAAESIFQISHDLRGQGDTFNYPLVTRIGSSLCTFTEKVQTADDTALRVIGVHIEALKTVIALRVEGDGGDIGREIAFGLEAAVEKIIS